MRASVLVFGLLLLAAVPARADFLFWLDGPTSRDNVHDPKNSTTHGLTAQATATPIPTLQVKVQDIVSRPLPGVWVELGTDAAGAHATDSNGQVTFFSPPQPVDVHLFPPLDGVRRS